MTTGGRVWAHCSPALLHGGLDCGGTERRPCQCAAGGSHDHLASAEQLAAALIWQQGETHDRTGRIGDLQRELVELRHGRPAAARGGIRGLL